MMIAAFKAGKDSATRKLVVIIIQTKSGTRKRVMPGALSVQIVTMRLMPVATEPMPITSRLRAQ